MDTNPFHEYRDLPLRHKIALYGGAFCLSSIILAEMALVLLIAFVLRLIGRWE